MYCADEPPPGLGLELVAYIQTNLCELGTLHIYIYIYIYIYCLELVAGEVVGVVAEGVVLAIV